MKGIINNLKRSDTWEIQLSITSKGTDEKRAMHSKSDNLEIMTYDKADEIK